jgi:DNA (cytosine-5)-methyltransferase 1
MKILNLYAGIGGNRKLWGDEHEITAVEYVPEIAQIYADLFPNDTLVIGDAHQYLLDHYKEFDFIWSSPPCPTHSKLRYMHDKKIYPDMGMYQEIILLQNFATSRWVVENVEPYYTPLITPTINLHRHLFWSNFPITKFAYHERLQTGKAPKERELLQDKFGFNLDQYTGIDKRKVLRNAVVPELGLHIFTEAFTEQPSLFATKKPITKSIKEV